MSKIYMLYDVGPQSRLEWITSALSEEQIIWMEMRYNYKNRVYKWRKPLQFLCYIELAVKSLYKSEPGDYIISWNFIMGTFIGCFCRFFRLKRSILSLNMISHQKTGIIPVIRKKLYNYSFGYNSFHFTVNSEATIFNYLKEYHFNPTQVSVLSDPYLPVYKQKPFNPSYDYIFCGGEAQRDWKTFFEAAKSLSQYKYVGVARKKYMPKDIVIPENVKMLYDIEEDEFDELLENASIVALPLLSSHAPAGLIVILKSILLSKPLIATRTPSIENYLENDKTALLIDVNDAEALKNSIIKLKDESQYAEELTTNAKESIQKYSPAAYSDTIANIIYNKMNYRKS